MYKGWLELTRMDGLVKRSISYEYIHLNHLLQNVFTDKTPQDCLKCEQTQLNAHDGENQNVE